MGASLGNDPKARAAGTRLPATGARTGIYRPRRPQASPLYRLVQDHFAELAASYDERFADCYGPWRPVVSEVVEKFLDCGLLEPGFARVRCEECGAEFLLAFSCKCRYFCPPPAKPVITNAPAYSAPAETTVTKSH